MDEQLYHYGVKGMKWGIRRTPAQLGHVPKGLKVKHKPNALQKMVKSVKVKRDASKEKKAKEKAIKERGPGAGMSNQELRSAIERLRLEEDYKALLARANPQKQSKAKDLFAKTALNMADQAFNAIGKNMIESAFQKKFDPAMYDIKDPSKADPKLLSDAIKYKQDQKKYKELTGATTAQTQKGKKSGGQQTQPASSGSGSKTKQTAGDRHQWLSKNVTEHLPVCNHLRQLISGRRTHELIILRSHLVQTKREGSAVFPARQTHNMSNVRHGLLSFRLLNAMVATAKSSMP